jgi:hypothetical protein
MLDSVFENVEKSSEMPGNKSLLSGVISEGRVDSRVNRLRCTAENAIGLKISKENHKQ